VQSSHINQTRQADDDRSERPKDEAITGVFCRVDGAIRMGLR
jgi:hypothetical protein